MDREYVGIDFHRRRSVIVRKNAAGEKLSVVRVVNDPWAIAEVLAEAGPEPEVVIEATYGWYWIVDWLQAQGANVHLAKPSGLNCGKRRVKTDERDANDLVDMLRLGLLPEAWIAPPATRELRELVRYRAKRVAHHGPGRANGDGSGIQRDRSHTPTTSSSDEPLPDPAQP
jgi:hypothetical protein